MCVLYGPSIQWLFYGRRSLNGRSLQDRHHYGVGHPRSDSVMPLVLCIEAYNIRGTGVVL
jgi:hypothetical protein